MKHPIQKFVLFGATGDLSQRMVWPSLYHLCREKLVPPTLTFVGSARNPMPNDEFRKIVEGALRKYVPAEYLKEDAVADLLTRITYVPFEAGDGSAKGTEALQKALAGNNRILYFMATSPKFYGPTCLSLAAAGLACELCRVVLEKPIGQDYASSVEINEAVGSVFHEDRIFRIDHYLGKEAVQNLLALRFANSLFEPLWNASSIDNVQITVAETVGLEGRCGLLRRVRRAARHGAEPHAAAGRAGRDGAAAPVRAERGAQREDQGHAQPAADHRGHRRREHRAWPVRRGQRRWRRRAGLQRGEGRRKASSDTETFVALRAEIDNWRWAGVPFYLRTGKRMQSRRTDIAIQFKSVPHNIFAADEPILQANRLVIHLQPQESVTLEILSKQPGLEGVRLREVPLNLSLPKDESGGRTRIAYERLLLDALKGNTTLFVRRDEVEAAWHWIDGIQTSWRSTRQLVKPYPAGTWGPTAAIALTERHGHSWYE